MLQLDLEGALDNVHHGWLVATLEEQGWPPWTTKWVNSFLHDRKATLSLDDWESKPYSVPAGVPQGSPISPLLFILFKTPLFTRIRSVKGIGTVGFADDTNIVALGKTSADCCAPLEEGWQICDQWARRRGMRFGLEKSVLMHFSRACAKNAEPQKLDGREIRPVESSRFLGMHLDRKLNFGAHRSHLLAELKTQRFAQSKIAAMTLGPSLLRSRDVYLAGIQSAMTYAASVSTTRENAMGGKKGRGTGLVTRLQTEQNKCLRVITGAYKSTPVKVLEAEANCMPIGIVLAHILCKQEIDFD